MTDAERLSQQLRLRQEALFEVIKQATVAGVPYAHILQEQVATPGGILLPVALTVITYTTEARTAWS